MTITELRDRVASRLNLTSPAALTRIVDELNERYRRVTSAIGLNLTRRTTVQANATIGVTTLTFTGCEKIINVVDRSTTPYRILAEISIEQLRDRQPSANSFVTYYAIVGYGSSSVTIEMDCIPQTAFTLYADGYAQATTLSGSQIPAFPEDFHDVLFHGAYADELKKMQQFNAAKDAEQEYQNRISDLRMFLAKSVYASIRQNDRSMTVVSGVPGAGGGSSGVNGAASYTQTGLITFDRDPLAPFAVTAGSARVPNLKVDVDFLQVQIFM